MYQFETMQDMFNCFQIENVNGKKNLNEFLNSFKNIFKNDPKPLHFKNFNQVIQIIENI